MSVDIERVFQRALPHMDKKQLELSKKSMELYKRTGRESDLEPFIRVLEEVDPGEARSISLARRR